MAVRKLGKLDPEIVDRTMGEIRADPALKAEMITRLLRVGARAFIEESFDLDERQRKEISVLENRDADDVVQRALLLALVHDGSIKVVHEGHQTPNLDVELSVGFNDRGEFFVEVSVSC